MAAGRGGGTGPGLGIWTAGVLVAVLLLLAIIAAFALEPAPRAATAPADGAPRARPAVGPQANPATATQAGPNTSPRAGTTGGAHGLPAGGPQSFTAGGPYTGPVDSPPAFPAGAAMPALDTAAAAGALRAARTFLGGGRAADARAEYEQAALLFPALGDWLQVFIAETYAAEGDTARVRQVLSTSGPVREIGLEWGWRIPVTAALEAGDSAAAARAAQAAVARLESAVRRSAAALLAGQIWQGLARVAPAAERDAGTAAARAAFMAAVEASPAASSALDAARALERFELTPRERLLVGRVFIAHGVLRPGLQHLEAFASSDAGTPAERAEVAFEAASAAFNARETAEAERRLRALLAGSSSARQAELNYMLGRNALRAGRQDAGRRALRETAERFPTETGGLEARFLAADFDHDDGELASALADYRVVAERLVGPNAAVAAGRAVAIALATNMSELALEIAEAHRARQTTGAGLWQASFWVALSHNALGLRAEAEELLRLVADSAPLGYYGVQAAALLGQAPRLPELGEAPITPPSVARQVEDAVARWDVLRAAEERTAASFELGRIRPRFSADPAALYQLAEELFQRDESFTGISIGRGLERRATLLDERLLRLIYPFPYREFVLTEAARARVDPFLAAGLIRQESMFNPRAVSPAGAVGLMQVMPATGRAIARGAGIAHNDRRLGDVDHNVRLGMLYLRDMLARHNGSVPLTLAAYNAGPNRVQRWMTFPEAADPLLFVERIPFRETRDYVRIVQANAEVYRMLYGTGAEAAGN